MPLRNNVRRVRARAMAAVCLVCTLLMFVLAEGQAFALDPHKTVAQYAHEVWSSKAGLPEADVMAILQTRDGYLWVGTEEGLARFDGVRFTVFDRKNSSLPNNRIQALKETPDGSLWIGTENGLSRLKDRQFTSYTILDGLPNNNIRSLWMDPDGSLWVTTIAGIRVWRGHGFERDAAVDQIAGSFPREFLRTSDGETWVSNDTGLKVTGSRNKVPAAYAALNGKPVKALLADSERRLWIGTTTGLYRLRDGALQAYPLIGHTPRPEITALLEDRDHNLWVGTLNDGIIRINKDGMVQYSVADGLSGIEVKSLYEDKWGDLWVGTFGGGIEVFRDSIFTPYGKREGISQNVVWSVMEGRDSSLWIGTQAGGLNRMFGDKVTVYSTRAGFTDNTVGSLFEGRDGTIWVGKDSGVSRFKDGQVIGAPQAGAFHEQVHTLYEDVNGVIWIGTRTSGLVELKENSFTYFTTRDGLPNNNVQAMIPSRRGGFWIGTLGGLSHLQNGKFTNLTSKDGLSADQVIALYEDAEGTLWIGSDGLNRLKDGKITVYGDREGLFDQNPLAILEDGMGYLWLSTNKGIFRVSKRQLNDFAAGKLKQITPVAFGTADGMRSAECNGGSSPSAWKDRTGNLWFATVAGVVKVDPRRVTAHVQPLQVHIEQVSADRQEIAPTSHFRLPPGGHELEFHYSAPYFGGSGRVRYKYKLEGFDKAWIDAGTRMVAYYTNLPPGEYQFRVSASAFDAGPGQAESAAGFYLTPHFYQTRWFYAGIVGGLLALVLVIWLWANRFMLARQNELTRLVHERTRELEAEKLELLQAKAALAQQATHDFLTGLMNRAAIFRALEEEMRQAERQKSSFAVILADLDHFKQVNDSYGHLVGDEVLKEFARRLGHNLRPYDHAGRFGGEEFLVIMPGLSDESRDRIDNLHRELCERPFIVGGTELKVTCSIGAASFHEGILSTESLLNMADQALYTAKANGRNRVETAGAVLMRQASEPSRHKSEANS